MSRSMELAMCLMAHTITGFDPSDLLDGWPLAACGSVTGLHLLDSCCGVAVGRCDEVRSGDECR